MIARRWTGTTCRDDADDYLRYVERTGIAEQRAAEGNEAALLLSREVDGDVEVVVLSIWADLDAVRRFAGDQYEAAVYYPEDDRYLIRKPTHVRHYEVVTASLATSEGSR